MSRALAPALLFASTLFAAEPRITVAELPAPNDATPATSPALAVSPEGVVWLSWLEPAGRGTTLRFTTFDAAAARWASPGTITRDSVLSSAGQGGLSLALGPGGRATAVWLVADAPPPNRTTPALPPARPGPRAVRSHTVDSGTRWSEPAPLTPEDHSIDAVSLATLADGRVLAVWIDARPHATGGKGQALFARCLGADASPVQIDPAACAGCQPALTAFPDGTALLAWRGHTADDVRDIRMARFRAAGWDQPRVVNADDWRTEACPASGPHLASDGGRVVAAWFTGAGRDPRVLASFSSDAGGRFLLPLQLSETPPDGRMATVLLHDGAFLVTWVDAAGSLWLRRVTPDFVATEPRRLVDASRGQVQGSPQVALLRDYLGGKTPAQFLLAFTQERAPGLRTLLVTVPEGDLLEAEKHCDCAPSPEQLRGFSLRGTIEAENAASATLQVRHFEVPGVLAEGTRDFRVAPALLGGAGQPGRQFLGRVERREGAWWLFDVRLIVGPPR